MEVAGDLGEAMNSLASMTDTEMLRQTMDFSGSSNDRTAERELRNAENDSVQSNIAPELSAVDSTLIAREMLSSANGIANRVNDERDGSKARYQKKVKRLKRNSLEYLEKERKINLAKKEFEESGRTIPVRQLSAKYNIAKSSLYDRLKLKNPSKSYLEAHEKQQKLRKVEEELLLYYIESQLCLFIKPVKSALENLAENILLTRVQERHRKSYKNTDQFSGNGESHQLNVDSLGELNINPELTSLSRDSSSFFTESELQQGLVSNSRRLSQSKTNGDGEQYNTNPQSTEIGKNWFVRFRERYQHQQFGPGFVMDFLSMDVIGPSNRKSSQSFVYSWIERMVTVFQLTPSRVHLLYESVDLGTLGKPLSVVECASLKSEFLSPMFVLQSSERCAANDSNEILEELKSAKYDAYSSNPQNFTIKYSDTGFLTPDILLEWLESNYLESYVKQFSNDSSTMEKEYSLLIVEGTLSDALSTELLQKCKNNRVLIFFVSSIEEYFGDEGKRLRTLWNRNKEPYIVIPRLEGFSSNIIKKLSNSSELNSRDYIKSYMTMRNYEIMKHTSREVQETDLTDLQDT